MAMIRKAAPVEQVQPAVLLLVAQRLAQIGLLFAAEHLPADQRLRKEPDQDAPTSRPPQLAQPARALRLP